MRGESSTRFSEGWPEQQDLQHARAFGLDCGETAQLLQHRRMHALRVLDDEQADATHAGLVREEALEQAAAIGLVVLVEREAELPQDLEQEFLRADVLALHGRCDDAIVEILEQAADQEALAAAVSPP